VLQQAEISTQPNHTSKTRARCPVIFQNGAFIYQWMEDKVIYKSELKTEIAERVIETARKYQIFYILYRDFLEEKDMYIDQPIQR